MVGGVHKSVSAGSAWPPVSGLALGTEYSLLLVQLNAGVNQVKLQLRGLGAGPRQGDAHQPRGVCIESGHITVSSLQHSLQHSPWSGLTSSVWYGLCCPPPTGRLARTLLDR